MVLSHGWPLSSDAFEDQMCFLGLIGIPHKPVVFQAFGLIGS